MVAGEDHSPVADSRGVADTPRGAHTLELEDSPSGGARRQEEEEADERSPRAHTQQPEAHKLLPPAVHNRDYCCSVVVGTADHPWGVGLSNYHTAAGSTRHTASRTVHGELWSCSLRTGAGSTNPAVVGPVLDTPVETNGHHSVAAVSACIADHVHCLFCSPEASAHMDLKDTTVGAQPAPAVEAILLAAAQTLKILKNSHSSQSLESRCAFAASDGVLPLLRHGGHRAGQGAHRPTVPLGVCQP